MRCSWGNCSVVPRRLSLGDRSGRVRYAVPHTSLRRPLHHRVSPCTGASRPSTWVLTRSDVLLVSTQSVGMLARHAAAHTPARPHGCGLRDQPASFTGDYSCARASRYCSCGRCISHPAQETSFLDFCWGVAPTDPHKNARWWFMRLGRMTLPAGTLGGTRICGGFQAGAPSGGPQLIPNARCYTRGFALRC